jgi:hypothetical protein
MAQLVSALLEAGAAQRLDLFADEALAPRPREQVQEPEGAREAQPQHDQHVQVVLEATLPHQFLHFLLHEPVLIYFNRIVTNERCFALPVVTHASSQGLVVQVEHAALLTFLEKEPADHAPETLAVHVHQD